MVPLADTSDEIGPSRHEADSFNSHDSALITSLPLFEGATHTNIEFAENFENFCSRNTLSDNARKELKLFIRSYLPQPNQVFPSGHVKEVIYMRCFVSNNQLW